MNRKARKALQLFFKKDIAYFEIKNKKLVIFSKTKKEIYDLGVTLAKLKELNALYRYLLKGE